MRRLTRVFAALAGTLLVNGLGPETSAGIVEWEIAAGGNGHFYEAVLVGQEISWSDASAAAQARPGTWHLATITSAEENSFVYGLVSGDLAFWRHHPILHNTAGPWLGGYSSSVGGNDWQWVTGEPWGYTDWGALEPFGNGDRLAFFNSARTAELTPGPEWNDVLDFDPTHTAMPYGYIVESEAAIPEPSTLIVWCLLGASGVTLGWRRRRKRAG